MNISLLVVLNAFFATSFALQIRYIQLNDSSHQKNKVNLSKEHINEDDFEMAPWWIFIDKNIDNIELTDVSDFADLVHLDIYNIGLDFLPTFKNLPKIFSISVKGNLVNYIKKEALGQTPVREVILTNNKISKIEAGSFGSHVEALDLTCNQLKRISRRWFEKPEILKEIDLSGNHISSLPENIFQNFTQLTHIQLSHNEITKIGLGAFSNRCSFSSIYLDNNKIMELSAGIFQSEQIRINILHLQYNRLSFLDQEFLDKVNKTKAVIYANPWECSCYSSIKEWNTEEQEEVMSYDYSYDNSDYEYEYEYIVKTKKSPKEDVKCMTVASNDNCTYTIDTKAIEEYEKTLTKRKDREQFCKIFSKG